MKKYDLYHMDEGQLALAIFEIADEAAMRGYDEKAVLRYAVWYVDNRWAMDEGINSHVTSDMFIGWAMEWAQLHQ